ncbi:hypothetical protein K270103H11_28220 [Gordonibacter urolithinfaciens]
MIREDVELHRAQRAFRSVLGAFARPGTVQSIELAPGNPARPAALDAALEAATRLFVDQAVTFCVADSETDATTAYLTSETHARRAPLRDADFVVVPARADAQTAREAVAEACRGTLTSPEKGATVLMGCARLAEVSEDGQVAEPAVHVVALRGPGVERENRFAVDRADWLRARDARGDEFPCGIEIVLVDPDGRVVAVPRSSRATLLDVKQLAQGSAIKEQMFHVKHSEAAPGEAVETGASAAGGASSASAEDRAFSVSAASAVACASAAKEVR